jgi:hypothetical protein
MIPYYKYDDIESILSKKLRRNYMAKKANSNLAEAKKNKNDEFYTQ